MKPTHVRPDGSVTMVDVSGKRATLRTATAEALVRMGQRARIALTNATLPKGDAFVTAQIAGIMAAKRTAELVPLTHQLPLTGVDVSFEWQGDVLRVRAEARTAAQTGVEIEAMLAASIAALTIYDMTKSLDKGIEIESVRLLRKSGGKSGEWSRGRA